MGTGDGDRNESPEAALATARRYLRTPGAEPWPQWRTADLPVPVQIAWLRAEIARDPRTVAGEPVGELLYQAVHGLDAAAARDPERLAGELAGQDDPVLRTEALRLTREAVRAGLLAPVRARSLLLGLLDGESRRAGAGGNASGLAAALLRELAEPWAALVPVPGELFDRFLTDPSAADAAIEAAARHGHRDVLRAAAADPDGPPRTRRRALELLGGLATREDIGDLVRLAGTDPLLLAAPCVRCLREMHQRGHFPVDEHVPAIVALALADHSVDADDVATVLYTSRNALLREAAGGEADEPTWPRRLELLVALAAQGTGTLPIGETVTRLLSSAPDPVPFLEAVRALEHTAAEEAVLAVLPSAPAAALDALEAVGGDRTADALREHLTGDIPSHLLPVRRRALEILWHLTADPEGRRSLLDRLDPRDLPARIASDLGTPDARELALLRSGLDPERPVDALCTLARNGDAATIPAIADLLMRVVSDVQDAEPPQVPAEAVAALRELGGRLYRRGKIRPRCLLGAVDADEAGDALAAVIALDLLDGADPSPTERAVLLRMLLEIPYRGTRARIHPLLRDRDPHVRKHAIALLARDTDGRDARALSAGLIPLTTAADVQTVRQALLALGHAGADGAAEAIAACLDHPNMNVKKTAAAALAHAGTPATAPKPLDWLGRHDNPGLRAELIAALQAVLGDGYAATVIAAADRAEDARTRRLLVDALASALPERAVRALAAQGSPAGTALLARLAGPEPSRSPVDELAEHGWAPDVARQAVDLHEKDPDAPDFRRATKLRPMLAHWLDLAAATRRDAVLRLTMRLCPPPWSPGELETFARSAGTLAAGIAGIGAAHRPRLLAVIGEAAAHLPGGRAPEVAERIRALPVLGPAELALLRRCGGIPARRDLERALAAAPTGEEAVLREAFGLGPRPEGGHRLDSRARLDELIAAYPTAAAEARGGLLDRMLDLQPLGAPPWTLAEQAQRTERDVRTPRSGDLDQPRSAAQRERLLAMLDDPARSAAAARTLLGWPEPEIRLAVLRALLDGKADIPVTDRLALTLLSLEEAELDTARDDVRERVARVAAHLDPASRAPLLPRLVTWWLDGAPATRAAAERALRGAHPDRLAEALTAHLDAGAWGVLDLLAGARLRSTPALARAWRRLHAEGHRDPVERITLVDGPLREPHAAADDAAALAALRERTREPSGRREPSARGDLLRAARTGTPGQIRRALDLLAEDHDRTGGAESRELRELLIELIGHPSPAVRTRAHRLSRRVLDRPAYLEQTERLLGDRRSDVVVSAVKTLSHAGWEPGIKALVGLLTDARPTVRGAAADGLVLIGAPAVPHLRNATGRARPDRRPAYTAVLDRITAR
ncbi:HEAT repeat domain-containing protein [Actinomadura sp. NAK00032]|uniref:HEAT repeat domain-containing protein n=1 Tax=Actinomadura sp. NAK00032 TaxID=2742128 RepID=UPI0015902676|nr:HEAT repeat domain-containing protein [Actinomadura sp. NAK00032]QKW33128.1 HEAT repeat domain-containing protein [Actinomadura sp. NAK00032]